MYFFILGVLLDDVKVGVVESIVQESTSKMPSLSAIAFSKIFNCKILHEKSSLRI